MAGQRDDLDGDAAEVDRLPSATVPSNSVRSGRLFQLPGHVVVVEAVASIPAVPFAEIIDHG
jgi:hypothetical protein